MINLRGARNAARALTMAVAAGLAVTAAAVLPVLPAAASPAPPSTSTQLGFSCWLYSYGIMSPVHIDATQSTPKNATVGVPLTVTVTTQPVSLPPALSSQLPALDDIVLSSAWPVASRGFANGTALSGKSGAISAGATTIPAITAQTTVIPDQPGPGMVTGVDDIKLTPIGTSGQPVTASPIDCTGPASTIGIPVTVTNPAPPPFPTPPPVKHTGPAYACRILQSGLINLSFPMTITVTGPNQVSGRDTVQLAIAPPQFASAQMHSAAAGGGSPPAIELTASLPVVGAQPGTLRVSGQNNPNAYRIKATGTLALTAAGQDSILLPTTFRVSFRLPHRTITTFACTLTARHDPAGAKLTITGSPTTNGSGTPLGAPNTGGGTGPGAVSVPLAVGGGAALLAGAGLTLTALRRRRKHRPVA